MYKVEIKLTKIIAGDNDYSDYKKDKNRKSIRGVVLVQKDILEDEELRSFLLETLFKEASEEYLKRYKRL